MTMLFSLLVTMMLFGWCSLFWTVTPSGQNPELQTPFCVVPNPPQESSEDSQLTPIQLMVLYWTKLLWGPLNARSRDSEVTYALTPFSLALEGVHTFSTPHLAAQVPVKMCLLKCKD